MSQDEDSDSGLDLEAVVTQTGMEWADAMEESSDRILKSSHQQNLEGQVKWSTVVTRKVSQVAAMHTASEISCQTADNGAADFVIPNKAGTDQMEHIHGALLMVVPWVEEEGLTFLIQNCNTSQLWNQYFLLIIEFQLRAKGLC